MTIYKLKSKFQNILRPIVNGLVSVGVTANAVTIIALMLSIAVGIYLLLNAHIASTFYILPIFLFVRMALNAIDGMIAKEHNMKTNIGVYLNELSDVISDTALIIPFAYIGSAQISVFAVIILSIISEMAGIIAVQIGHDRRYDGPMGKSDRAFIFGVLAICYAAQVEVVISNLSTIIWVISGCVGITIMNRIKNGVLNK